MTSRVKVWDLPLRLFHWALVAAVTVAIVTAKLGGSWMAVHGKAGLTIVGLLAFRLVWGVAGPTHARFACFAPTPGRIGAYLRGTWKGLGHNPLGALSVFALLGLLALQATTGLFSNDDIDFSGPLYPLVDESLSSWLTGLHHRLSYGLYVLMGLHVAAVLFYLLVKKRNLVKPMVTGWAELDAPPPAEPAVQGGKPLALAVALTMALAAVYALSWR